jgi:lactate permease
VYRQILDPVSHSLGLTAIFAVMPLAVLFILAKMVSPQNLAIGAAAVGLAGKEGDIFRQVIGYSIFFALLMGVLVLLQSGALSFMVP